MTDVMGLETKIRDVLEYHNNNLKDFVLSERDLYKDIEKKTTHFFNKGGLNLILITGLRGTGKTTILKTLAKKYNGLYVGGDLLRAKNISLEELTKIGKQHTKKLILIDEILYIKDWQNFLKIELDSYNKILFVISGSSALQLNTLSQDLSRRMDHYELKPLSFKEFLSIKYKITVVPIQIDIFSSKLINDLFLDVVNLRKQYPDEIYSWFEEYVKIQFPFLLEEVNLNKKIYDLIEKVIYKDIPMIDNLLAEQLFNIESMLRFLSTNEKTSYTKISNILGISVDTVIKIMGLLEKADLIYIVPDIVPTRELGGKKKVLFTAPSLRFALNEVNLDSIIGFAKEDLFGLIVKNQNISEFGYNYNQNGFDFLVKQRKFEIGNNKKKIKENTIVIGNFIDVEFKNKVLYLPFALFALIVSQTQS